MLALQHSQFIATRRHVPKGHDGLTLLTSINPVLKSRLSAIGRQYWRESCSAG